ncbi:hypothetical protein K492DRAFT_191703 [Lichtheimia hyalospora FSU 10163]|nr:hypothetical protein K492DRAFT_191703 [Lichtheimia hyalospora FSU 10163]
MSGTIRLYYKPEVLWQHIDDQLQNSPSQDIEIVELFPPGEVPMDERGFACIATSNVVVLIEDEAEFLAKVTSQGDVGDEIQNFIDNVAPRLIAQA